MRYLSLVLIFVFLPLCSLASKTVPKETKDACVLVRSYVTEPGAGVVGSATGTGFLVAPDLVLTCNHLLFVPMEDGMAPVDDIKVKISGKGYVRGSIVLRDKDHDIALVRLAKPMSCQPVSIAEFALSRGDSVSIVGNFPDAVRVTEGLMMTDSIMEGFGMTSAKVRSGFSGGPIIASDGRVYGILSQRDREYNSIFVRSDVIIKLLRSYERRSGKALACIRGETSRTATGIEYAEAPGQGAGAARTGRLTATSATSTDIKAAAAAASVALPVRPKAPQR